VNDWKLMSGRGGVLIISDIATEQVIYHDRGCPFADRSHFLEKVVRARSEGATPNGRYFWRLASELPRNGEPARASIPPTR
jgi:hypothetical protein